MCFQHIVRIMFNGIRIVKMFQIRFYIGFLIYAGLPEIHKTFATFATNFSYNFQKKIPKIMLSKVIMLHLFAVAETKKIKTGLPNFIFL